MLTSMLRVGLIVHILGVLLVQVQTRFIFRSFSSILHGVSESNLQHTNEPIDDESKENSIHRQVVIIGSGPAGATASIYTARAMLKPLQISGYNFGGQLMLTSDVENFPGYRTAVTGPDLIDDLSQQAKSFGSESWQTDVTEVDFSKRPFTLTVANGTITADAVIIASGANALWLHADREKEFQGKGISTCATCDGFLFRGESVVVVGGGDSAMEEANFLTRFAKKVTIVHRRDSFRASKIMLERAQKNPKIEFLCNARIERWEGSNGVLSGLQYIDTVSGTKHQLACKGAFIAIGHKPNTKFLGSEVELDSNGYIVWKENTMTSVPGVFACGDVADTRYKQAITAAGTGCQAAIDAERWLEEQE
mmetsp:Transcript_12394/g.20763  ORF Transcript_12394/g.20763 Transcript_12394/m.20763 type:complete len:365 (-) Transcript_12394:111-1205(-)